MSTNPDQTVAPKRGPGRPPADADRSPPQPAVADMTFRYVPPLVCPMCGRGMTPKLKRWRPIDARGVASADCDCTLCGKGFVYTPAVVRPKK
jgi:hypothetical protein